MKDLVISPEADPKQSGVVVLEFMFLLPLIVGLFYGGAVYGVLFFDRLEMQRVVDRAAGSVLFLDRRQYSEFGDSVLTHANNALQELVSGLPDGIVQNLVEQSCDFVSVDDVTFLECRLEAVAEDGFMPTLSLGFLGQFPSQPQELSVSAAVAF